MQACRTVFMTAPGSIPGELVSGISQFSRRFHKYAQKRTGVAFRLVHVPLGIPSTKSNVFTKLGIYLIQFLRLIKITVLTNHSIFHINTACERVALMRDFVVIVYLRACFFTKKKVVVHFHGGKYAQKKPQKTLLLLIRLIVKLADSVLILGEDDLGYISSGKKLVVDNFIDDDEIIGMELSTQNKDGLSGVFLGRLSPEKGLDRLIEMVAFLREQGIEFRVNIFGDGPLKEHISNKVRSLNLDDLIVLKGVVSGKEKQLVLGRATHIILLSDYEGIPLALLEGMGAGCIPIATSVGGIPDVVDSDNIGVLVDVERPDWEVVSRFIQKNNEELHKCAENCITLISNRYVTACVVDRILEHYAELCA